MSTHAALLDLAHAHAIATEFWDWRGESRAVAPDTLRAVLRAMDVPCETDEDVAASLADLEDAPWRDMVPPVTVVRQGSATQLAVHVPDGAWVHVWMELDHDAALGTSGGMRDLAQLDHYVPPRFVDGAMTGRATFEIPSDLPLGWHTVVAQTEDRVGRGTVVVSPGSLALPTFLERSRAWGVTAQLYSVRSRRSWGVGDFRDLADMGFMAASRLGADFLLINPIHAAEPAAPMTPSPYLPATRAFINPLYIRPEDIDEYAYMRPTARTKVTKLAAQARGANLDPSCLDRDASWTCKRQALELIFDVERPFARQEALEHFTAAGGKSLRAFALWSALEDYYGPQAWPTDVDHSDDAAVEALAAQPGISRRVEFFTWLQWIADEQVAAAQRACKDGGMRLGLMQDLAVGVHPFGADVWALSSVLAPGMTVGAPPDNFNQQGQNWSQPPWRPDALARAGYAPYRDMVRSVLRHAGAVRIDHIIGLFRLWWIPAGMGPGEGTYVRFDHEAMVSILVLEAYRAGAMVVGEDLGLVEPWVRSYLTERGVLGTSVLWFEKGDDGMSPRPPEQYRHLALATVTTHDLPPTAGYLAGEHIELRNELGLLDEPVEKARADSAAERNAVVAMLRDRGLVGAAPTTWETVLALHRLLLSAPSVLVGVALVDMVGERRTQNQPGTDREYPNWCVPLADGHGNAVLLDTLFDRPDVIALAQAVRPLG